ncbi:uncharacterized protein LOC144073174 [Stigmatopora argus]
MDTEHTISLQKRFEKNETVLKEHGMRMGAAEQQKSTDAQAQSVMALTNQMQQLTVTLTRQVVPDPSSPRLTAKPSLLGNTIETSVKVLDCYVEEPKTCIPLVTNIPFLFQLQPYTLASEDVKVGFINHHLKKCAPFWETPEWERQTPACTRYLMKMRQGYQTVAAFAFAFRNKACQSNLNSLALCYTFLNGLDDLIKNKLLLHALPVTLDGVMELATRVDLHVQVRRQKRNGTLGRDPRARLRGFSFVNSSIFTAVLPTEGPESMQLRCFSHNTEKRKCRRQARLCLY